MSRIETTRPSTAISPRPASPCRLREKCSGVRLSRDAITHVPVGSLNCVASPTVSCSPSARKRSPTIRWVPELRVNDPTSLTSPWSRRDSPAIMRRANPGWIWTSANTATLSICTRSESGSACAYATYGVSLNIRASPKFRPGPMSSTTFSLSSGEVAASLL